MRTFFVPFVALFNVFPVPGLVEVRSEAEALRVVYEPFVSRSADLDRAIRILRIDGTATDIDIKRAAGKVRAVDREPRATGVRRIGP